MKTTISSLLFVSIFCFTFFSCKKDASKANQSTTKVTEPVSTTTPNVVETKPTEKEEPITTSTTATIDDQETEDATVSNPASSANSLCGGKDLISKINTSANSLKGTPYSQANKTDCSGMFHKMLDTFREDCPNAILPTIEKARSSRDIAKWYYDQGTLKIIRDPAKNNQLIKPGMVMFYGYGARLGQYDFNTLDIETLMTRGEGINHVAIVTSVEMKDGVVESYDIFHGRTVGKPADVTTSSRVYTNRPELPMYGNWKEPWLAVADVLVPKS